MKRWLPAVFLVAALFISAVQSGNLVPSFGGGYWFFPIGSTNTIVWSPGLQAFFGTVQAGIQQAFYIQFSGGNGATPPQISGRSDVYSSSGLDLTTQRASGVTIYPGTDIPSAFVVKNMSGTVSELVTDTISNTTKLISLNIASGTIVAPPPGTFTVEKSSRSGTSITPGPSSARFEVTCGTSGGTASLLMYAGTSPSPFTVLNNVGSGVSGC